MTAPSLKYQTLVWGGLGAVVLVITLVFAKSSIADKPLPVYGTTPLPNFNLTNQLDHLVTDRALLGQVWICDIIFTRCASQCLRMSELMSRMQSALPAAAPVKLVSLTADPEYDRPNILKKYGDRFGADPAHWLFLTGEKNSIYHLAGSDGLKFVVSEKKPSERDSENDLFIHTTKMVLVDKTGRIRGWFDSEEPGALRAIVAAAKQLSRE
jgi:protein SCO1/2